jgi:HK97 family phage major capsid protein
MSAPVYASTTDRGRTFARYAMSLVKTPDLPSALGYAREQFGESSTVTSVLRAAVAAGTTADANWAGAFHEYQTMVNEFFELVRPRLVISQLPLRTVPLNVRVLRELDGAVGYWVGQGAPKPLTSGALDGVTLPPAKVVALAVLTQETLRFAPAQAESLVAGILARALAQVTNETFLSDAAEISGVSPAGVLSGATVIVATGDAVADLSALVAAYAGSFDTAAFIMRASTAVELTMVGARSASSTFIDLTAKGGTLFGLPCVTSTAVPEDSSGPYVILIDAGAILFGAGLTEVVSARHASLQMDNEPTNNAATATGTQLVSLFQTDSVGIKVQREINWSVVNSNAVVALSGANYMASGT